MYAHRRDSDWHDKASKCLLQLAQGKEPWAIPWPCLGEFYSVVTHPRIYTDPTPPVAAVTQINAWLSSPTLVLLGESPTTWPELQGLLLQGQVRGSAVHDARITALCLGHGISELWSADKDFSRYPSLKTRNPLI